MKKNSFKRFLAVTLAAATALTFAPVSTLGLYGVVEAQAAALTTIDGIKAPASTEIEYGSSSTLDFTVTTTDAETVAADSDITASVHAKDSKGYVTSTPATGATAKAQTDRSATKNHTVKVAVVDGADKLAIGSYELQVTMTSASDATKTFTSDFTVVGKKVTSLKNPTDLEFDVNGSSDTETGEFTITYPQAKDAASTPSALAPADLATNFGVSFTDKDGKDATSKFKLAQATTNPTTDSTTATTTADGVGTTHFVVMKTTTAPDAGKYTLKIGNFTSTISVINSAANTDNGTGQNNVGVIGGLGTVTASNGKAVLTLTDGNITESGNTWMSLNDKTSVQYAIVEAETNVSSKTDIQTAFNSAIDSAHNKVKVKPTGKNNVYTVTVNNNDVSNGKLDRYGNLTFGSVAPTVTLDDGMVDGDYSVIVVAKLTGSNGEVSYASKKVTFTISAGSDNNNNGDTDITNANSDTFGGVTTSILATDDTEYSLVNPDAKFKLNGTEYTATQLKWYLTKAPSTTPANIAYTNGAGSITGYGIGQLKVKVSNAKTFANESSDIHIVGIYAGGAQNIIVYNSALKVTAEASGVVTKTYDAGTISATLNSAADNYVNKKPLSDNAVDKQFIGTNNKFLKGGDDSTIVTGKKTGRNFDLTVAHGLANDNVAKGSSLQSNNTISENGVYYEKYYVEYVDVKDNNTKFVAEITLNVSVNAGPKFDVKDSKDGHFYYSSTDKDPKNNDEKVIDLDLAANKTFDIKAHIFSDNDKATYTYSVDTQNVTVDANGLAKAVKEGTAVVTITPSADGVKGDAKYIFFRVNKNAGAQITVTGKDGDSATVLSTRQYQGNAKKLSSEKALAAAQVQYVQIEVTGKETIDKKEALTVKGADKLTFALADADSLKLSDGTYKATVDSKTGEITVNHAILNDSFKSFIFPVKVVASESATSALTTRYFYVVVDYPDADITGLESSYTIGTSLNDVDEAAYLNLKENDKTFASPSYVSSNAPLSMTELTKSDALDDSKFYSDDEKNAFSWTSDLKLKRATAADKTEHVLIEAGDASKKIGNTYKVVEIKSVAGKRNYVTKIENAATGETLYQAGSAVSGASITIDKTTKVKVTVANAPSASLNPQIDPAFEIYAGNDGLNYNTQNLFVAATVDPKTYEVTLVPSQEGTQIIAILPTEGRLSATDYSLVGRDKLNLVVKYKAADDTNKSVKPAKVTGVKIKNAKGAKVTVTFKKDKTNPNMKYYVQKQTQKKKSGKSVGSNKTTLSVKSGKSVKVRVKAYYYDANGVKHVGKYSAWTSIFKTDKK